jgi:hypothetical protein
MATATAVRALPLTGLKLISGKVDARAHRSWLGTPQIAGTMLAVCRAKAFGDEHLDLGTEKVFARVAEQHLGLAVDEHDAPVLVGHHRGIRRDGRGVADAPRFNKS